ncbi:hypothetical protein V8F20_000348 [Naviculisporaceae sp. PSN 640]
MAGMSSSFSDSFTGGGLSDGAFASQQSSARSQSTQPSVDSQSTLLETALLDPNPAALGNAWSSYLSAQYQSREVAILRRATGENFKQVDACVGSLKRDLVSHDAHVKACAAECAARSEQMATQIADVKPVVEKIPSLEQDLAQHKELASTTTADINQRLMAMQQSLEAVQGQYRSALEMIELLQGELRVMRDDKIGTDTTLREERIATGIRLAALEREVSTLATRNLAFGLPQAATVESSDQGHHVPLQPGEPEEHSEERRRPIMWRKLAGSRANSLKGAFYDERRTTKANPPKPTVTAIGDFFRKIKNPALARQIQEGMLELLPGRVEKAVIGQTTGNLYVNISENVTFEDLQWVLGELSALD